MPTLRQIPFIFRINFGEEKCREKERIKAFAAFSGVALGLATIGADSAAAAVIRSPISATATSEFSSAYDIGNTIDQSGLSVGFTSGVTDFDAYLALNPAHTFIATGFEWFTAQDIISAVVTYDLGNLFKVDRVALWNEDSSGIGIFDILASSDGVSFSTIATGLSPLNNPDGTPYKAETFNFGPVNARYFRFDISGCPQPDPNSFTFNGCGIGEVAFSTSSQPIPTPALLPGLIGMGVAALRKRNQEEGDSAEA